MKTRPGWMEQLERQATNARMSPGLQEHLGAVVKTIAHYVELAYHHGQMEGLRRFGELGWDGEVAPPDVDDAHAFKAGHDFCKGRAADLRSKILVEHEERGEGD
jgi:hypothetical protein